MSMVNIRLPLMTVTFAIVELEAPSESVTVNLCKVKKSINIITIQLAHFEISKHI